MTRLLIPLFFLGLPMAEIAGFIIVGRWLGLWSTLALVVLTSLVGAALLRIQGFKAIQSLQTGHQAEAGKQVVQGAMIFIAGLLLILPGFITDTLGFLLFVPAIRDLAWRFFKRRIIVFSAMPGVRRGKNGEPAYERRTEAGVLDLDTTEFHRDPDDDTDRRRDDG